jgi:hypothetical protein
MPEITCHELGWRRTISTCPPGRDTMAAARALIFGNYDTLSAFEARNATVIRVVAEVARNYAILRGLQLRAQPIRRNAFNVSSTLPPTSRSRWLLIRSLSIVMTLPNRLGASSAMAASFC